MDLPDDLYRSLKARAALSGITMRALIQQMLERGLAMPEVPGREVERLPFPILISTPLLTTDLDELKRIAYGDDEDEKNHFRSD